MIIMGLDAALARTGVAILEVDLADPDDWKVLHTDVIQTYPRIARPQRLHDIRFALREYFDGSWKIDHVFIEKPGHWARMKQDSNQETVEALAQVRGVMLETCADYGVTVTEISTNDAKATLAHPTASKEQIQQALRRLKLYDGEDGDIADAIAVSYAGARQLRVKHLEGKAKK